MSHLFWQLDVQVLDGGGEVGILLGVGDHGALWKNQAFLKIYITFLWEISKYLYDVPRALHVHPWLVHRQELHALQVAEAPEQNLRIIQTFHFPNKKPFFKWSKPTSNLYFASVGLTPTGTGRIPPPSGAPPPPPAAAPSLGSGKGGSSCLPSVSVNWKKNGFLKAYCNLS